MQTIHTDSSLVIENLSFERNDISLFHQVNSKLSAGQLLEVRGANGCGKSTFLRILAGYIEPHAGYVFWHTTRIHDQRELYQQQLHFIGHLNGIKTTLTVAENLKLNCALNNISFHPNLLSDALKTVGLQHHRDKLAGLLSAGQQRRLALARLTLKKTALWILDEPATALDVEGQTILNHLLASHLDAGGIAIIATHQDLPKGHALQTLHLGAPHV